ncbi:MAG: metal ABC transporter ATP-binding protein [Anaerolineales bacterium]|nr:MAG: metal ABC transporter ATP-binding protein [Anaerolineales bacterium]
MTFLKQLRKNTLPVTHVPHHAGQPTLEVRNLSVRYDQLIALSDISFSLEPGERIAVVGPNGAGKSTLFKAIAGIHPYSTGEVKIYGHGPGGHTCIAYLPQRSQVDWNFPASVADVVMMGRISQLGPLRWPKASDWDYVRRCLQVVGLVDLEERQIGELSGGQQQRMFIARALAQEAELMLMDEPFTGLDVPSQNDILDILEQLRLKQVTVLASTHDLNLASEHFDQVLLLNRRQLGFGPGSEIFTTERLLKAYGGHLRLVENGEQMLALGDTCCDDEGDQHEHLA